MQELQQIMQLGGTVTTVFFFLWYLQKKDSINKETYQEFNNTIKTHLKETNKVTKVDSKSREILAKRLQEMTNVISNLKNGKYYKGGE